MIVSFLMSLKMTLKSILKCCYLFTETIRTSTTAPPLCRNKHCLPHTDGRKVKENICKENSLSVLCEPIVITSQVFRKILPHLPYTPEPLVTPDCPSASAGVSVWDHSRVICVGRPVGLWWQWWGAALRQLWCWRWQGVWACCRSGCEPLLGRCEVLLLGPGGAEWVTGL